MPRYNFLFPVFAVTTGFNSKSYVRHIYPWLCELDATEFRQAVQTEGMLTIAQVHRLEGTLHRHGGEQHNQELLRILLPSGISGFVSLYSALSRSLSPSFAERLQLMRAVIPDDLRPH